MAEMNEALALDPACEEAAEVVWRATRKLQAPRSEAPSDPAAEQRLAALLARAAPGAPEAEARQALAELALIAPDDPRVVEALRERR
jgi:hypothetical protein